MFNFFGLSCELRDHIYVDLLIPEKWTSCKEGLLLRAKHVTQNSLLLVNRQFQIEYLAASARCGELMFVDVNERHEVLGASFDIPRPMKFVRTIDFRLWIVCGSCFAAEPELCSKKVEVESHLAWIKNLLKQMQSAVSVSVVCYISQDEDISACMELLQGGNNQFQGLQGFQKLVVAASAPTSCGIVEGPPDAEVAFKWDSRTKSLEGVDSSDVEARLDAIPIPTSDDEREGEGLDESDCFDSDGDESGDEDESDDGAFEDEDIQTQTEAEVSEIESTRTE